MHRHSAHAAPPAFDVEMQVIPLNNKYEPGNLLPYLRFMLTEMNRYYRGERVIYPAPKRFNSYSVLFLNVLRPLDLVDIFHREE